MRLLVHVLRERSGDTVARTAGPQPNIPGKRFPGKECKELSIKVEERHLLATTRMLDQSHRRVERARPFKVFHTEGQERDVVPETGR